MPNGYGGSAQYEILECPKCGHSLRHDFTFSSIGSYEPTSDQRVTCPGCGSVLEWYVDPWIDQGAVIGWTPHLSPVSDEQKP